MSLTCPDREWDNQHGFAGILRNAAGISGEQRKTLAIIHRFIRKPYRPEEIFDCLTRHLGVRFLHEESTVAVDTEPAGAFRARKPHDGSEGKGAKT